MPRGRYCITATGSAFGIWEQVAGSLPPSPLSTPQILTTMTKSNILAAAFAIGIILCSLGIIGLLCGISRAANIISALLAGSGMLLAFGAEALNPKRPR